VNVYYRLNSDLITEDELKLAAGAIQRQMTMHVAPAWNAPALIHVLGRNEPTPARGVIRLVDDSDIASALGYHDENGNGLVGIRTCLRDGVSWTSCLSHETGELTVDRPCTLCFQFGRKFVSCEPWDPTEAQGYDIDGIEVSNFVLPSYYITGSPGPWDYLGLLPGPFPALAPGGYQQFCEGGEWDQINAEHTRASKREAKPGSRRARRAACV
jgi:hypothetical protein